MTIRPVFEGNSYQVPAGSLPAIKDAVAALAQHAGIDERGAVFTRPEVVDFILDLVGYTADKPLYDMRILEPSAGDGHFLIPVVKRLLHAWRTQVKNAGAPVSRLSNAILAIELHADTLRSTRARITELLCKEGLSVKQSATLVDSWLVQGDFLLTDISKHFDFVVGNPPYVRQELIPDVLMSEYRQRYHTIYDRADLYIPFIERSLTLLKADGHLGFICADRWMKNRYGGPLRKFIADTFHLKFYVDMVDTQAFLSEVSAYPAITVFTRSKKDKITRVAHRPGIDREALSRLAAVLKAPGLPAGGAPVKALAGVAAGSEPWLLESADQLVIVRKLESRFPLLEETGCKVGIGVATGLDKVFIGPFDELAVEADRKLPLATTRDLQGDALCWKGQGVINPFADDGSLVDLNQYPLLKKYLTKQKHAVAQRHVALKNPANWYRTLDRIHPALTTQKKLLIPDIKGEAHVVLEEGKLYPHHNLYYITSDEWDLKALQAVLQSGIARLFVSAYSTKIRGGYLRFQAQYLRRIRIPHWNEVSQEIKQRLLQAVEQKDMQASNAAVFELYRLTKAERAAIGNSGD